MLDLNQKNRSYRFDSNWNFFFSENGSYATWNNINIKFKRVNKPFKDKFI